MVWSVGVCTLAWMAFQPTVSFAQTQACCSIDGTCSDQLPADCLASGGLPGGPGTSCIGNATLCSLRPCCIQGICQGLQAPQFCESQGGTALPLGSQCEIGLVCPEEDCNPSSDGQSCEAGACLVPGYQCSPRCVNFNAATGDYTVIDCDCRDASECSLALPTQTPQACILPDNGSGTADLPPAGCAYTNPDWAWPISEGLPAGSMINLTVTHTDWTNVTRTPGGIFGGEIQQFSSVLHLDMTGTGDLAGFHRVVSLTNVQCTYHAGPRTLSEMVQTFPVEIVALQGQITGDPDFDLLRIKAGDQLELPSGGMTNLVMLPGGNFAVDSFFDVFYEIEFVGAAGGSLAGMSGTTLSFGRLQTGISLPNCAGYCSQSGAGCTRDVVWQQDGSAILCCDCVQPPPSICQPTADGSACENVTCSDPTQRCVPVSYAIGGMGETIITACDCRDETACRVQTEPGPDPQCSGECAGTGEGLCQEVSSAGGFDCLCTCIQDTDCDDQNVCTTDTCDTQSGTCMHIPLVCDDNDPCTTDSCDPTEGCIHVPVVCDDGSACTTDSCNPANGFCVYLPNDCDDQDLCTVDTCDPQSGNCSHTAINCDDGDFCTEDYCDPQTGGCVHEYNPDCPQAVKWNQSPTPDQASIASNVWGSSSGLHEVNRALSDDFRSDGRPIHALQWWGSYLNPAYAPVAYGGIGQTPFKIDGWLISFSAPRRTASTSAQLPLGLYFAPADAVEILPELLGSCDQYEVFSYRVRLGDCLLVQSRPDTRVPANDACRCPAKVGYFCERACYWYDLSIQAVVGTTWIPVGECSVPLATDNSASADFWGWLTAGYEMGRREALEGAASLGAAALSSCPPLDACSATPQWLYGPWTLAPGTCAQPWQANMAFALLTSETQVSPPCPTLTLVSASSLKGHVPSGGAATNYGTVLPLGSAGVEPRSGGPTRVSFFFNQPIAADDGSLDIGDEVTASGATITNLVILGTQLRVDLTGAVNASCVHLQIENGPDGITTLGSEELQGDNDVHIRVLAGDINSDGEVNVLDLVSMRNNLNVTVTGGNFRSDVNLDAIINIFDLVAVRNWLNTSTGCP